MLIKKIVLVITVITFVISINLPAYADLAGEIEAMYKNMGVEVPTTLSGGSARNFEAQGRSYFVGGGARLNTPVEQINLLDFESPSIKAGCGGIDLYMGSFSYVNKEELNQLARAIAQNAVGYAFQLALSTMCPSCKEIIDQLKATIDKINQMLNDSCRMAQVLVNSGAQGLGAMSENGCIKNDWLLGGATDTSSAKYNCQFDSTSFQNMWNNYKNYDSSTSSEDEKAAKQQSPFGNLTWDILNKVSAIDSYDYSAFKGFFLSTYGSLVTYKTNGSDKVKKKYFPAIVDEDTFRDFVLPEMDDPHTFCADVGTIEVNVYTCNTKHCTDVEDGTDMEISQKNVKPAYCLAYEGIQNAAKHTWSETDSITNTDKFWIAMLPSLVYDFIKIGKNEKFRSSIESALPQLAENIAAEMVYNMLIAIDKIYNSGLSETKFPQKDVERIKEYVEKVKAEFLEIHKDKFQRSYQERLQEFVNQHNVNRIFEEIKSVNVESDTGEKQKKNKE